MARSKFLVVVAIAAGLSLPTSLSAQQREPIGTDTATQVQELAESTCQYYADYGWSSYDQCYNEIIGMYSFGGDPDANAAIAFCSAFSARTGKGCFA